jgi:hypothetical protein
VAYKIHLGCAKGLEDLGSHVNHLRYVGGCGTAAKVLTYDVGMFIPLYSISLFLPTIIKSLGYQNNEAQLMTVPPYVVGCVFTIGGTFTVRTL